MWPVDFDLSGRSSKRRKIEHLPKSANPIKEPTFVEDLATHPKKVAQVRDWLERTGLSAEVLLITGPTGSAKTTTLKCVAASLNIHVQEWVNPVDKIEFKKNYNWLESSCFDSSAYNEPSQLEKFESFAFRGSRYQTLFSNVSQKQRILLVEDFPNIFLWKPATFFEFLKMFKLCAKCPIVFIVTDDDKCNISQKLFPDHTIMVYKISQIKFNAISQTGLMSVLKNRAGHLGKETLQRVAISSNGDIRTALASLNFLQASSCRNSKKITVDKDVTTDFYQSLGRVLYPKLKENPQRGDRKFLYDVFAISEQYDNTFLLMLQENFLHYFSSVNDVITACDVLSDSDVLDAGGDTLITHAGVLCVTGLMLAHKQVQKKFMSMRRSRWSGKIAGVIGERTRPYPQMGMTSRVLNLDVIPYLKRLPDYATVLTECDARRMSVHISKPTAIFKPPPVQNSVFDEMIDDELKIEEFED